jgi:NAD(P)-dependent dehydrogenase (short-subunit alcohol dehydrogenase family)
MKTVIVTGASRGIGAAICRELRTKGVRVIGVARSADALKSLCMEKIGSGPMEYIVGDVTDPKIASSAVELAVKGGSLDALILNAAMVGPIDKLTASDMTQIKLTFDVNVFSALTWIKVASSALKKSHGRVIITSSAVTETPFAGFGTYCATKAAVNMFVDILAQEEPEIITMAVEPGIVDTEMSQTFAGEGRAFLDDQKYAFIKANMKKPEEVAGGYAKLALAAPKEQSGKYIRWSEPWIEKLSI